MTRKQKNTHNRKHVRAHTHLWLTEIYSSAFLFYHYNYYLLIDQHMPTSTVQGIKWITET